MQIHELKLPARKGKKTIGRGGKRGTTSGRGTKGQKARSGGNVDPLFEGGRSSFIQRAKKMRGAKASILPKRFTVTLTMLERAFEEGEKVTVEALIAKKVVERSARVRGVKIVHTGALSKKLTLDVGIPASAKAAKLLGVVPNKEVAKQ
jgi:large subunit ribosomal protein L15